MMKKPDFRYYVFLDIDGVLATQRQSFVRDFEYMIWCDFDPVAVKFLNKLHDSFYGVEFVLTSTWKFGLDDDPMVHHWIECAFRNANFRGNFAVDWKTKDDGEFGGYDSRAYSVKEYLDTHNHDGYIIFDDSDYSFNRVLGEKRFIKTDPTDGMLTKHMMNAWALVNQVWADGKNLDALKT